MQKLHKGDQVQILIGKDSGKQGTIEQYFAKEGKVAVAGVNVFKRHIRRMGQNEGGIIDINKPVDISNVALVCPNCQKPTRVGFSINGETKVRVCKKCKKEIVAKTTK